MSIPLATTHISVEGVRPQSPVDPDGAGYGDTEPTPALLASNVRASITQPTSARKTGNVDEQDTYSLRCDLVPSVGLSRFDVVIDETTGTRYRVVSTQESIVTQFGLQHTKATLRLDAGLSGGNDDPA